MFLCVCVCVVYILGGVRLLLTSFIICVEVGSGYWNVVGGSVWFQFSSRRSCEGQVR